MWGRSVVNRYRVADEVVTGEFVSKLLSRLLNILCLLSSRSLMMSLREKVIRDPSLAWTPFPRLCSKVAPSGCKHAQPRADAPPAIAENMLTQICCGICTALAVYTCRAVPSGATVQESRRGALGNYRKLAHLHTICRKWS